MTFSHFVRLPLLFSLTLSISLIACNNTKVATNDAISSNLENKELIQYAKWSVAADPYGSTFETTKPLIQSNIIDVRFDLAAQDKETEYPFAEVISKLPVKLSGAKTIELTYRADKDLFIKLSQSDFSHNGDQSFAHFYTKVAASHNWRTTTVNIEDFTQPKWAPQSAIEIPLNLHHVDAIYIAPDIDQLLGGSANISIRSLIVN